LITGPRIHFCVLLISHRCAALNRATKAGSNSKQRRPAVPFHGPLPLQMMGTELVVLCFSMAPAWSAKTPSTAPTVVAFLRWAVHSSRAAF